MLELLVDNTEGLQNVYTPLPFSAHLIFCIIATVVYCAQYYRKNRTHYLLIALAVDATFLTQLNTSAVFISALGIVEIALLVTAGVFYYKTWKAEKKADTAKQEKQDDAKAQKEQEKIEGKKDNIDNAFDD